MQVFWEAEDLNWFEQNSAFIFLLIQTNPVSGLRQTFRIL